MRYIKIIILLFFGFAGIGQITVNTNFTPNISGHIDSRCILTNLSDTSSIAFYYEGMLAFITSTNKFYYYETSWKELSEGITMDTTLISQIVSDSLGTIVFQVIIDSTSVVNAYGTIITESPANQWNIGVDTSKIATLYDLSQLTDNDTQDLSIDSTGRVFTISLTDGGSVKFEDTSADSSKWTRAGMDMYNKNQTDSIGINTTNPTRTLDINGEVRVRDLTTGTARSLVGEDGSGVLQSVTIGTGLELNTQYNILNSIARDSTNIIAGYGINAPESPANTFTISADTSELATQYDINGFIDGTGVANRIPYFSDSNTLTSSDSLYRYAGGDINVNGIRIGNGSGDNTSNIVFGEDALYSNDVTGANNVAIGSESLYTNTTGAGNTGIGFRTLYRNTIGQGNIAIGSSSLFDNISGDYNTAIGNSALASNLYSDFNVAIGHHSLLSNSAGEGNTAIGHSSMVTNTFGSANVGIGKNALLSNTTGNNNIAIGYESGRSNTTGNGSIFIGKYAGYYETADNSLYITRNQGSDLADSKSKAIIYGLMNGSASSQYLQFNADVSMTYDVGIGTTTPATQLHTTGTVRFAGAGTPGIGKVLTSDADGTATWETPTGGGIDSTQLTEGFGINVSETDNDWTVSADTSELATHYYVSELISDSLSVYTFETDTALIATMISDSLATIEFTGGGIDSTTVVNSYGTTITEIPANQFNVKVDTSLIATQYDISGMLTGSGTATRIPFWAGSDSLSSNANLYWDNTNSRLGLGLTNPSYQLDMTGAFRTPLTTSSTVGGWMKSTGSFIHDYGTDNFFAGLGAGNFTMTGTGRNVGVGKGSLLRLTNGYDNVGLGAYSLAYVTSAYRNLAIGTYALNSMATGNENIGIGISALYSLVSGGLNVAIGRAALFNLTASNNTAIGAYAGFNTTATTGGLYLGYYAGYQNAEGAIGNYNTVIGYNAGRALGSGTDNILLGRSVELALPNTSSQLNIGNVIYATGLATGSTPSATGRLGIGTSTPATQFHTTGTVRLAGLSSGTETTAVMIDSNKDLSYRTLNAGAFSGYSAGFGLGLTGTTFSNTRYWSGQDTLKTTLSGLVKATSGVLTAITDNSSNWNTAYGWGNHASAGYLTSETGDISSVSATAPLTGGGTSGTVTIGITQSGASSNGYLSSTDWSTFNGKVNETGTNASGQISYFTNDNTITSSSALNWINASSRLKIGTGSTSYGDFSIAKSSGDAGMYILSGSGSNSIIGLTVSAASEGQYSLKYNTTNGLQFYSDSDYPTLPVRIMKQSGSSNAFVFYPSSVQIGLGTSANKGLEGQALLSGGSSGEVVWGDPTLETEILTGFMGTDADQNITTSYSNILWDDTNVFDEETIYSLDGTLGDGFIKVDEAGIYEVDAEIVLHNTTEATNHTVEYYLGYYSTVSSTYNYPIGSYIPIRYDYIHAGTKTTAVGKMIIQITSPTTQRIILRMKSSASTAGHVVAKAHNQLTIKKIN